MTRSNFERLREKEEKKSLLTDSSHFDSKILGVYIIRKKETKKMNVYLQLKEKGNIILCK